MVVVATQHHEFQVQQRLALVLMAAHHSPTTGTLDRDQTIPEDNSSQLKLLLTGSVKCVQCSSEDDGESSAAGGEWSTMEELIQSRLTLMKAAMHFKYGDTIHGPNLDHMVRTMADAVIKFEHLSTDPGATLKLEMPSAECSDGRFDGVFVLYNYARLSNILRKYQQEIQTGRYPPLPELSKVDLSLLREEEEWILVLQYILNFPTVVKEAAEVKGHGLRVHSVLKKLSQFLNSLCRTFSGYYSRYKVLLTPEPHLLPLVHARVYLLKVIQQILFNGLSILGISPLDQL